MHVTLMAPCAQAQDLRATPHNMARHDAQDVQELCVFCHAPTLRGGAGTAPLWQQRSIDATHAFGLYDDVGLGMLDRVGSHSLACLSCHDATQAPSTGVPSVASERDHPVGVPYPGAPGGPRHSRSEFRPAASAVLDGRTVWWVPSGAQAHRRSRSDLPLFGGGAGEGGAAAPLVECGTCHDPHTTAPVFLRLAGRGSQLCFTCHAK